jgi:hypothetical protein
MFSTFWDVATMLDPAAVEYAYAPQYTVCRREPLQRIWRAAGLADVTIESIEVPSVFESFEDYWQPFLAGEGPAAGYLVSLPPWRQSMLRRALYDRLPIAADGSLPMTMRAWAIRGTRI